MHSLPTMLNPPFIQSMASGQQSCLQQSLVKSMICGRLTLQNATAVMLIHIAFPPQVVQDLNEHHIISNIQVEEDSCLKQQFLIF